MVFQTVGKKGNPAVLFIHAMGVNGESSLPVAEYLKDRYYCIMPTSTVYCEGQAYVSKAHQLPDQAGAIATPVGLLVLLFAFDWRLGLLSLVPVVLGFLSMVTMTGKQMAEKCASTGMPLRPCPTKRWNTSVESRWSVTWRVGAYFLEKCGKK